MGWEAHVTSRDPTSDAVGTRSGVACPKNVPRQYLTCPSEWKRIGGSAYRRVGDRGKRVGGSPFVSEIVIVLELVLGFSRWSFFGSADLGALFTAVSQSSRS